MAGGWWWLVAVFWVAVLWLLLMVLVGAQDAVFPAKNMIIGNDPKIIETIRK